jgi:hypothetical protein
MARLTPATNCWGSKPLSTVDAKRYGKKFSAG